MLVAVERSVAFARFAAGLLAAASFHWTGCSTQPTRIINIDCEYIQSGRSVGGECQSRLLTVFQPLPLF